MHIPLAARILFVVVSVSAGPWWMSFVPRSDCTQATEVVCSDDCSQVMVCLGVGPGGFLPVPVATCDVQSNMKCSAVNKTCLPADESDCQGFDDNGDTGGGFRCHNVGSFPDPNDCQKFHLCLEGESSSVLASCNGTSAYDPLSRECSLTTSDRVCTEGPIKPCSQLGQMGVVHENRRIYYVCMQQGSEIVPEMYLCPLGMIFELSTASCVETPSITDSPTETMGRADTTIGSLWIKWTSQHCHGRHREGARRWRSRHGRHHWMDTTTAPSSVLPGVTLNEAGNTTAPPWGTRRPRLWHRRHHSGRARWWSHRGGPRWMDTATGPTTDLPRVTTDEAHSTADPWATLGRAETTTVLPGLTLGRVDSITAPGPTSAKVYTTAVPLLMISGDEASARGRTATTMIPPWMMVGGADTAGVSPFVTPGGVDTRALRQATLGEVDTTEDPPQETPVPMVMRAAPQGDGYEFPVVVIAESSGPLTQRTPLDLVGTATIPSMTPEE